MNDVLGEVSAFENNQQPSILLLISLAIYKDKNRNNHRNGFYKIAEQLGKGDFKNLKDELYGFSEAEECRKFWQKDENYQNFISIADKIQIQIGLEFFNQEEQTFFKKWQYKVYDPNDDEHVDIKNIQWQQFGKKKCSFGTGNRKTVARF